ncbi:MAG TPA: 4Fe-4S binding protein [bacterium]|nr:4Fe-4S binding protein [bacterium]
MAKIEINKERCKQCGLCMVFCNQECIAEGGELNAAGYFAVEFVKPEDCKGCGLCAEMCPDLAIQVWK